MHTIFLLVTRGLIARNILRTDIFATLQTRKDLRIVLLVPRGMPAEFRAEFAAPNVLFEEISSPAYWGGRHQWNVLLQNLVYTESSRVLSRHGNAASERLPLPLAVLEDVIFSMLSRVLFLKRLARAVEYRLFPDHDYDALFVKYRPDLVVATSMLQKEDTALLKGARRYGVHSVGFSRGWDSVDKKLFRVAPDRMVVWTPVMRDSLMRFQDIPSERISVVGFPQFDVYADPTVLKPRAHWLADLGFPPDNAVIFFGSEGVWSPTDEETLDYLIQTQRDGMFSRPCSIFIRPHFSDVVARRFDRYRGTPGVYVDNHYRESSWFFDHWDPNRADMVWLANSLAHSDVLVTTGSTLLLDAIAMDRPAVTIAYDPASGPMGVVKNLYKLRHLSMVFDLGGIAVAGSKEELRTQVNDAILRPEALAEGRARVRESFCGSGDGKAGRRAADAILHWLDEIHVRT